MDLEIHSLSNGIRLVHQAISSPISHCGIIINTGSRDESEDQHGMAHFIEHLLFKGTKKRKAHHILSRMEDVGGEMNAYTTKEETCLHATFYNNYYDRAFEIISDILFNSSLPVNEIRKEKEVIIDEINSYKDSPIEQLFDDFEEMVFNSNSIARNILGNEEHLKTYTREELLQFYRQHYPTTEMIVSSIGNVSPRRVLNYFQKHFGQVPQRTRSAYRQDYNTEGYAARQLHVERKTYQAHCIIGNQAYSTRDERRFALHLLNNILCGSGMNSRLNVALREKRGLAYNVESTYSTYSDTGILTIYFGTDKEDLNRCIAVSMRELDKICSTRLGTIQMARAKRQLIGQVAIGSENFEQQMIANGRSLLLYDRIDSLKEITDKINRITTGDILEVANHVLDPDKLSQLAFY